ncbi:thiamine-phosphate kinase [Streptosporangiaceae bacterium NEAU-GS5]|nr:thiamine-phosphate kinase [Streptosporangiaceae bacterium NEAU-GS5]
MTVGDLGEFGVIKRISRRLPQGASVLLGPGDDAAVLGAPDGRVVVTTDLLIERMHFRRDWSSGYDIGRKAAAQNLSDVVAMGARPTGLFVGLGMPADTSIEWLDALTDGLRDECAEVGASLAGGDITRSEQIVLGVTAIGDLEGRPPVTRSGARVGDVVAIAGRLGWAAAGLAILHATSAPSAPASAPSTSAPDSDSASTGSATSAAGSTSATSASSAFDGAGEAAGTAGAAPAPALPQSEKPADSFAPFAEAMVEAHRRPRPPYAEGPRAAMLGATAMLDVSDGLVQDLGHLAAASRLRVVVDPAKVPVPDTLVQAAAALGADVLDWVLSGGEDHALAATFPPDVRLSHPWQVIGYTTEGDGVQVMGREEASEGWDHFRV